MNLLPVNKRIKEIAKYALKIRVIEYGYMESLQLKDFESKYLKFIFNFLKKPNIAKELLCYRQQINNRHVIDIDASINNIANMPAQKLGEIFLQDACYQKSNQLFPYFIKKIYRLMVPEEHEYDNDTLSNSLCRAMDHSYSLLKFLLNIGISPNFHIETYKRKYDDNGLTPLTYSICRQHFKTAKSFFQTCTPSALMFKAQNHSAPIHFAAQEGWMEGVSCLLAQGVEFNEKGCLGQTPLFFAAKKSHFLVVKILLEKRADPNILNDKGKAPIQYACSNIEIFKMFLQYGANPDTRCNSKFLIHKAIELDQEEIVELLYQYGADLNKKEDYLGRTPLMSCVMSKKSEMISKLLMLKANPNEKNTRNESPLSYFTCYFHDLEVVELLLKYGADPNDQINSPKEGTPLLYFAANKSSSPRLVWLLLHYKADPNSLLYKENK